MGLLYIRIFTLKCTSTLTPSPRRVRKWKANYVTKLDGSHLDRIVIV